MNDSGISAAEQGDSKTTAAETGPGRDLCLFQAVLIVVVAYVLVTYFEHDVASAVEDYAFSDFVREWLLPRTASALMGLALLIGWIRASPALATVAGVRLPSIGELAVAVVSVPIAWGLNFLITLGFNFAAKAQPSLAVPINGGVAATFITGPSMASVVGMFVATAVVEEILFRALLLTRLHGLFRNWAAAILVCSALFALFHFHGGLRYAAGAFAFSMVWSALFAVSRNLPAVIAAHFLFNLAQLVLNLLLGRVY